VQNFPHIYVAQKPPEMLAIHRFHDANSLNYLVKNYENNQAVINPVFFSVKLCLVRTLVLNLAKTICSWVTCHAVINHEVKLKKSTVQTTLTDF
jgi:hypothetical protein